MKRTTKAVLASAFVALAAPGTPASAQTREWAPAPEEAGRPRVEGASLGIAFPRATTGAERRAAVTTADRVLDVLRRSTFFTQPHGYDPVLSREAHANLAGAIYGVPYSEGVSADLWEHWAHTVNGARTSESTGKVVLTVMVNAPTCDADGHATVDSGPPVLHGMHATGTWEGYTVYDGTCVLVTRRREPPVVPVTRERWLHVEALRWRALGARTSALAQRGSLLDRFLAERPKRARDTERAITELRRHDPAAADRLAQQSRQMEDAMEAQYRALDAKQGASMARGEREAMDSIVARAQSLDAEREALSPGDRAAPAWIAVRSNSDSVLVAPDTPGAVLLQQPNPAFFDRALAPDVPQCIAVMISAGVVAPRSRQDEEGAFRWLIAQRVRDGIDWTGLAGLLRP